MIVMNFIQVSACHIRNPVLFYDSQLNIFPLKYSESLRNRIWRALWRIPFNWVPTVQGTNVLNLSGQRTKMLIQMLYILFSFVSGNEFFETADIQRSLFCLPEHANGKPN